MEALLTQIQTEGKTAGDNENMQIPTTNVKKQATPAEHLSQEKHATSGDTEGNSSGETNSGSFERDHQTVTQQVTSYHTRPLVARECSDEKSKQCHRGVAERLQQKSTVNIFIYVGVIDRDFMSH